MNPIGSLSNSFSDELHCAAAPHSFQALYGAQGIDFQAHCLAQADQLDRADTVNLLCRDDHGLINGCARLLSTERPYPLAGFFSRLLPGQSAPCSAQVWELSHVAALDHHQRGTSALSQSPADISAALLREIAAAAAGMGAHHLVTVASIGFERLLRRAGLQVHRTGPPSIVNGHPVCICWITLTPQN